MNFRVFDNCVVSIAKQMAREVTFLYHDLQRWWLYQIFVIPHIFGYRLDLLLSINVFIINRLILLFLELRKAIGTVNLVASKWKKKNSNFGHGSKSRGTSVIHRCRNVRANVYEGHFYLCSKIDKHQIWIYKGWLWNLILRSCSYLGLLTF